MKNNLVVSPIDKLFKKNTNNVILGKWYNKKNFDKKFKINLSKFNFYSTSRKRSTYKFLKKKYNQKINEFVFFLNKIHNLNEDRRYWEIIIGPFVYRSLIIIWDRWDSIRKSIKYENITNITLIDNDFTKILPKNNFELNQNISNIYINHFLYSEAFKELKNNNIKISYLKSEKIKIKKLDTLKVRFSRKIFNFIFRFLRKDQKFLFYNSYIPYKENILLNLKLGNFPSYPDEFEKSFSKNKKANLKIRSSKFFKKSADKFDNFYNKVILKLIPFSYIEDFKEIKDYVENIQLNPKIAFTAVGHLSNDVYKIWTASRLNKGLKLIASDHGGNLEETRDFFSNRIYDRFIQWQKTSFRRVVQLPPNIFLGDKKTIIRERKNKILFILTCTDFFKSNIFDRDKNDYDDYLNFKKLILDANFKNSEEFFFKIHPSSPFKDLIIEDISKSFGKEKCDISKFNSIFSNYKLLIDTNPQTTYLQCLRSGVPTLLYYDQSFFKMNKKLDKSFKAMKKHKLIFSNLKNLNLHLLKIVENPHNWWNSREIKTVVNNFNNNCSLKTKNDLKTWEYFLKNYEKNI